MPSIRKPPPATSPPARTDAAVGEQSARGLRRYPSESLFGGALELVIEHRGAEYRLRQTSLGKLILTK